MNKLTKEAGIFRNNSVGIFTGEVLVHMAPPSSQIPILINDLLVG